MWIWRAGPACPAGPIAPFAVTPVPPGVLVPPVAFLVVLLSRCGVPLAPRLVPRPVPLAAAFVPCLIPLAVGLFPRPVPLAVGLFPRPVPLTLGLLASLLSALCRALGGDRKS